LLIGALVWIFLVLRRPLRERHESELLLDLIEDTMTDRTAIERRIIDLSASEDQALGERFKNLGDNLREGKSLKEGIEEVPGVLPIEVKTMVIHGLQNNSLPQVMLSCRQRLNDCFSRWRTAMSVVAGGGIGVQIFLMLTVSMVLTWVYPKFEAIFADMVGGRSIQEIAPLFAMLPYNYFPIGFAITIGLAIFNIWLFAGLIPSSSVAEMMGKTPFGRLEWAHRFFSWKRLRVIRDFSTLLSSYLDSGMPEAEAVQTAGEATGDSYVIARSKRMLKRMENGETLLDAFNVFEKSTEFQWRYKNAARAGGSYVEALSGWHNSLDSRAYFKEQRMAQILTAIVILMNGVLVVLFTAGIFQVFSGMIQMLALWDETERNRQFRTRGDVGGPVRRYCAVGHDHIAALLHLAEGAANPAHSVLPGCGNAGRGR
tara:strand:- start:6802 stop:8085 length:1284 start_codon:yes stop_codon:yes gene_type:complete